MQRVLPEVGAFIGRWTLDTSFQGDERGRQEVVLFVHEVVGVYG